MTPKKCLNTEIQSSSNCRRQVAEVVERRNTNMTKINGLVRFQNDPWADSFYDTSYAAWAQEKVITIIY